MSQAWLQLANGPRKYYAQFLTVLIFSIIFIVNFTQIIYTIPAPKAKLIAFGVKLEAMEKFTSERQYTLSLSLVKGNIHYLFH